MVAQSEDKSKHASQKRMWHCFLWSPTCEKDGEKQEIKPQTNKGSTFLFDVKCYLDSSINILNIIPNSF